MDIDKWNALHECVRNCEVGSPEWCESLARIIDELINGDGQGGVKKGLKLRFQQNSHPLASSEGYGPRPNLVRDVDPSLLNGDGDPPWPYERLNNRGQLRYPWETHNDEIRRQQNELQNKVEMYEDNDCPDGGLPADREEWMTRPLPTVEEWVSGWHGASGRAMPTSLPIPNPVGIGRAAGVGVVRWIGRMLGGGRAAPALP